MKTTHLILVIAAVPVLMANMCTPESEMELPDHPSTDEYFTWRLTGNNANITNPPDSVVFAKYPNDFNVIVSYSQNHPANSYLSYYGPQAPGIYSANYMAIYSNGHYFVSTHTPVQLIINSFGSTGQPITGTYSGNLKDSVGTGVYPVHGTFKITNPY